MAVNARSVLASALLAVILIVAGSWALNNTSIGLNIKCRVFNDLGACLIVALTEPYTPSTSGGGNTYVAPPTESPEQRAAREAAEEQARLDAAVQDASSALGDAIDDVSSNADDLKSDAADMASSVDDVRSSLADMQSSYNDLTTETEVKPMDDVEQGQVCVALGQVEVARGQVEVSVEQFSIARDPYDSTLADRAGYVSAVQSAAADLELANKADLTGASLQHTVADADAALSSAASTAKAAASKAAKAKTDVASLVKSADALMSKARGLAATVASC